MELFKAFEIIKKAYEEYDTTLKQKHGKPFFDTEHGIWGASAMLDTFELFMKMHLDEKKSFVDLGSGDGRVVLIASLFTNATGIEGNEELTKTAIAFRDRLGQEIPELLKAKFLQKDYTTEPLGQYEILFTFADHPWSEAFEKKLLNECDGYLLSYNRIFLPQTLKKGKTYWIQQLPIISYPLNRAEEDLFGRPLS